MPEKANVQLLGVKRNLCHSLYVPGKEQVDGSIRAVALNGEFDSFTLEIPKQGKGEKEENKRRNLPYKSSWE